jgi:hypothetical protein
MSEIFCRVPCLHWRNTDPQNFHKSLLFFRTTGDQKACGRLITVNMKFGSNKAWIPSRIIQYGYMNNIGLAELHRDNGLYFLLGIIPISRLFFDVFLIDLFVQFVQYCTVFVHIVRETKGELEYVWCSVMRASR